MWRGGRAKHGDGFGAQPWGAEIPDRQGEVVPFGIVLAGAWSRANYLSRINHLDFVFFHSLLRKEGRSPPVRASLRALVQTTKRVRLITEDHSARISP